MQRPCFVGASRRAFRVEFVPCGGIERALQERAEDGCGPVGGGGIGEKLELGFVEREGAVGFEELAIIAADAVIEQGGEFRAAVHFLPHLSEEGDLALRMAEAALDDAGEGFLRQEAGVFGEEGEEAALEKRGHDLGIVAVGFETGGEPGEDRGDLAGDARGLARGGERESIEQSRRSRSRTDWSRRSSMVMRCL